MVSILGMEPRVAVISAGLFLAVLLGVSLRPAEKPAGPKPITTNDACHMAERFVDQRLKAPSTAKHPWCSDAVISQTGENEFLVISYVDSQNSFGAMLRTKYAAKMRFDKYDEKRNQLWTLLDLAMTP